MEPVAAPKFVCPGSLCRPLWYGKASHEGKSLRCALTYLAYFVTHLEGLEHLPELKEWHWRYYSTRHLQPIAPSKIAKMAKIMHGSNLVAVAINIIKTNTVAVYLLDETFLCTPLQSSKRSGALWHVKNYMDCEEGQLIENMVRSELYKPHNPGPHCRIRWRYFAAEDGAGLIHALSELVFILNREASIIDCTLPSVRWKWHDWTTRHLYPIPPSTFLNAPFQLLKSYGLVCGIAIDVPPLRKVIVFSFDNFFACEDRHPWAFSYGWHVKNYIDFEEGSIIEKMFKKLKE